MKNLSGSVRTHGIAPRLIVAVVLFSSLITLIATAIQLYRDYHRDLQLIDSQLSQIQDVHMRSIAGSLWLLDEKGMRVLVEGILRLPDIHYLEVSDGNRVWASGGVKQTEKMILREYRLTYQHLGQLQEIGTMTAVASLGKVYQRLFDKAINILVSNAIRTFLVAGFTLLVFHFLVTRHLIEIAGFVRNHDLDRDAEPLQLERRPADAAKKDELDQVVDELNQMRDSLQQTFASLRDSESKYRELFDNMAQGVIYQDANGQIISANPAAIEILGLSMQQLLERNSSDHRWKAINEHGGEFLGSDHPSMKSLRSGSEVDNVVMGVMHPQEQQYRWIIVNSKPQFHPGESEPYQVFSTFTDITERKQVGMERERLIDELAIKNRELERFVYTISHDLKTPLVTIAGFSGILASDIENGEQDKLLSHLQHVTSAVATMSQLLDELLELSRVGRIINSPETISMRELIHDVANMLAHQALESGVKIEIMPDMPDAYGDKTRIREVVQNLTENAIKFSRYQNRAKIRLGWRGEPDNPVFYVSDNGLGIDPAYHHKIFDLFERLDPKVEGTGVGLALVRRIMEEHGGKVWIESEGNGSGSTFCFNIPSSRSAEAQSEE